MSETVEDIVREMRVDAGLSEMGVPQERMANYAERIEAAHKTVADELAKQQAYDAKLEADFAALREAFDAAIANADNLAEVNRRLREELKVGGGRQVTYIAPSRGMA